MAVGVVADLVALGGHAAHQVLVARDPVPHQKKGGGHLPQLQSVQQGAGGGGPGAVVKGEGHQGRIAQRHFSRGVRLLCGLGPGKQDRQRRRA